MSDFTGERLVPGEVDADLWNEHISRYFFAASLFKSGERVLDAGCGTGYGASLLNRRSHAEVLGIDVSPDAITHALGEYAADGVQFAIGRCESLPAADGSMSCITAFEVIEHLDAWREFLGESRRVLSANGLLLVSTPNRTVYAALRGDAGPNPFHVHEFDFEEFSRELSTVFPFVRIFGQNHTGTITLTALGEPGIAAQRESLHVNLEAAGYLLAVCSKAELPAIPNFVFVPEAANTLLERERHIHLLTDEVAEANHEFAMLLQRHRAQIVELERSNQWANSLNVQLSGAGERIGHLEAELKQSNAWADSLNTQMQESANRVVGLQTELAQSNTWAGELDGLLNGAKSRILELQDEVTSKNEWAVALERESEQRGRRVLALQQELEERTAWAQTLEAELAATRARVQMFESSGWVKIGKTIQVVPRAR